MEVNLTIYGHCLSCQQPSKSHKEAVQRQGAYSDDKWKKVVYSREPAIIGILEEAITGHIVSTPIPASTVEEFTQLRTATSHAIEKS